MCFNRLGHMIEDRNAVLSSPRFGYRASYPEYYNSNDNVNRIIGSISNN